MELSVSIVNYNTKENLKTCVDSVLRTTKSLTFEIIVVDNASADGSAQMVREQFPSVKLIANTTNLFYSKGYNQAFSCSSGDLFLILNADVEIRDDILPRMVKYANDHPDVGILGCRSYAESGKLQKNCSRSYPLILAFYNFTFFGKLFPSRAKKLNEETFYGNWDRGQTREVEMVPGSMLMLRRSAIGNTPPFDEHLLMYFSDNDLCERVRENGFKIVYLAEGKTVHIEGASVNKTNIDMISRIYRGDIYNYFLKRRETFSAAALLFLIQMTRILIRTADMFRLHKFKRNLVWGTPGRSQKQ